MNDNCKIIFCRFLQDLKVQGSKYPVYLRAEINNSPKSSNTIIHGTSESFDFCYRGFGWCAGLSESNWLGFILLDSIVSERGLHCLSPASSRGHLCYFGGVIVFESDSLSNWLHTLVVRPVALFLFVGCWLYGIRTKQTRHCSLLRTVLPELVQHYLDSGTSSFWPPIRRRISAELSRLGSLFCVWYSQPYVGQTRLGDKIWYHNRIF